jgi:hypothetical protein
MTECITEIEDTRKEMYKVGKQMVKMKDSLINQKFQQPTLGYSQTMRPGAARVDAMSPGRDRIRLTVASSYK